MCTYIFDNAFRVEERVRVNEWKWLLKRCKNECEQPKAIGIENEIGKCEGKKNEILNDLLCLFTPLRRMHRIILF